MWDKYIQDLRIKLERLVPHECHWWVLLDAVLCISIKGHIMNIKLPLPKILGTPAYHDEWKFRERNGQEIKRVRNMWSQLVASMTAKIKRIDAGESTVWEEFKDGILLEDGKYGLVYKGRVKTIKCR